MTPKLALVLGVAAFAAFSLSYLFMGPARNPSDKSSEGPRSNPSSGAVHKTSAPDTKVPEVEQPATEEETAPPFKPVLIKKWSLPGETKGVNYEEIRAF